VGIVPRGRTSRALRGHCAAPQDQSATLQVLKMPQAAIKVMDFPQK